MEMEGEREDEHAQLKDFFHDHQLVFNDEQYNKGKETCCSACGDPLLCSQSYSCEECDQFHLHVKCAEAPLEIDRHPLHWEHPFLILRKGLGFCDLCQESVQNFIYRCPFFYFSLDVKCALFSSDQKFPGIQIQCPPASIALH